MPRHYNDAKLQLGEPWASKVDDFLMASHKAQFVELVRRALDAYIDKYLKENEGFKRDFEKAKAKRRVRRGRSLARYLPPRMSAHIATKPPAFASGFFNGDSNAITSGRNGSDNVGVTELSYAARALREALRGPAGPCLDENSINISSPYKTIMAGRVNPLPSRNREI